MEQKRDGFLPPVAAETFGLDDEQVTYQARLLFEQLYAANVGRVQMLARRYLHNQELTEDVVQETFLRVFKGIDTFDPRRPAWPWISAIARHVCVDLVRRRALRPECTCDDTDTWGESTFGQAAPSPEDELFASERRRAISDALGSIVGRYRRALMLRDVEGWCYEDIANLEGLTIPAVKSLILRARRKFRECWQDIATERGLNGVVGFGLLARVRGLRRGTSRATDRVRSTGVPIEVLSSSLAQHVSAGLTALTLAFVSGAPGPAALAPARAVNRPGSTAAHADVLDPAREPAPPTVAAGRARVERGALEAAGAVTAPHASVRSPEEAEIRSITFSPRFAEDRTVFLAGRGLDCRNLCAGVMFVSRDAGTTWTRLEARDSAAERILLPPKFGAGDGRIFASGAGLEVSTDGGRSFQPLVPTSPLAVGRAAISPRFNDGDARIVVGGVVLARYVDDLGTITPEPSLSLPGPFDPTFSPDGSLLWLGGRRITSGDVWTATVFRCAGAVCDERQLAGIRQTPAVRLAASGRIYGFVSDAVFEADAGEMDFARLPTPSAVSITDVLPASGSRPLLLASWDSAGGGLWALVDAEWRPMPEAAFARGVTALGGSGRHVVAALATGGVACSADGGRTWASRCAA